jgi:hypothetical protein
MRVSNPSELLREANRKLLPASQFGLRELAPALVAASRLASVGASRSNDTPGSAGILPAGRGEEQGFGCIARPSGHLCLTSFCRETPPGGAGALRTLDERATECTFHLRSHRTHGIKPVLRQKLTRVHL